MSKTKDKTTIKRPTFLTILLILRIVFGAIGLLIYGYALGHSTLLHDHGFTTGEAVALTLVGLLDITGALLIWNWYKSGLYLMIAVSIFGYIIKPTLAYNIVPNLAGLLILYIAMRSTWKNFS